MSCVLYPSDFRRPQGLPRHLGFEREVKQSLVYSSDFNCHGRRIDGRSIRASPGPICFVRFEYHRVGTMSLAGRSRGRSRSLDTNARVVLEAPTHFVRLVWIEHKLRMKNL